MSQAPCALIMAGGTGGHIFPGLAVAEALRADGWRVHWLGAPNSMEARLVPPRGFPLEPVQFGGVRGKGVATVALLPLRLLRAFWQSLSVVRRVRPDVVVGFGGYITFPGAMMGVLAGKPLVLHEQNSVAGMANRVLAGIADRVFTAYPRALPKGEWIGNPLRAAFVGQPEPRHRFEGRQGPLRVLVVGGSLGAQALNEVVPAALKCISPDARPIVTHQSGEKQIDALRAAGCERIFEDKGVSGGAVFKPALRECVAFMREGDELVITRLDRLSRSLKELIGKRWLAPVLGVSLTFSGKPRA